MYVGSVCTQPPYTDKNAFFIYLNLNTFLNQAVLSLALPRLFDWQ